MEPELRAHVNLPVVPIYPSPPVLEEAPINREGLYVIIAAAGVSNLGFACALTYSFTSYSRLKRNAEEVRQYIAAAPGGAKADADQHKSGGFTRQPSEAGGSGMSDALSATVLLYAGNEISEDLERLRAEDRNRSDASSRSANDHFPVFARQETSAGRSDANASKLR
ncbi:uncharacterized protein [Dermacentor albipictus]|uniref:uncharacterized protein n=1 Tax=Dermacentor albipictus TaxID=60249 RepID=UPI0038FCFFCA